MNLSNNGIGFSVNSNVNITVTHNNIIEQNINIHNKATQRLVTGMLRFIAGDFNTTNRQRDKKYIKDIDSAKGYIPCYINCGTGGIQINTDTNKPISIDRDNPPLIDSWGNEKAKYTDTKLLSEITGNSRIEIGNINTSNLYTVKNKTIADTSQIILSTDIPPGHCNIYDGVGYKKTPAFITEIGLFASATPDTEDLLARVVIPKEHILYIRPQDIISVIWTITIISLGDLCEYQVFDNEGDNHTELVNNLIIDMPTERL